MANRVEYEATGSAGERGAEDPGREAWGLLSSLVYPPPFILIARRLGLSPATFGALRALDGARTMSELAALLHCDNSNVTGIVDALEAKGLAERRPSARDRRVKLVELTAAGRRLRARMTRAVEQPPQWLQALSAEDRRTLRDVLARAAAAIG